MQEKYEAPHLIVIGQADQIVMGTTSVGMDHGNFGAPDFEFEHDDPLI